MSFNSRNDVKDSYNYNKTDTTAQSQQLANQTNGLQQVQIQGRTSINDPTSNINIKVNASGQIETTGGGGGGGDATASNQTTIINNQTNGTQKAVILGNDGNNDHVLHVDSNGNAKCIIVNSLNTIPANSVNSKITDSPANSMAVGCKARTDPALASSEVFLKSSSNNELLTRIESVNGNVNVKLEDLSSSIDAEHANNSRSLPTTMKCRTNITDETSGKYLLCSNLGELKISLNDINSGIVNSINVHNTNQNVNTQVLSDVDIAVGAFTQSTAITTINGASSNSVVIYIHLGAGMDTTKFSYEVHKSYDNTHYFLDPNFSFQALGADTNANPQPALTAKSDFDGRFIRVKVNNLSQTGTTAINAYIQQRQ